MHSWNRILFFATILLSPSSLARLDEGSPSDFLRPSACRVVAYIEIDQVGAALQNLTPGEGLGVCQVRLKDNAEGIPFPCTTLPAQEPQDEGLCGRALIP